MFIINISDISEINYYSADSFQSLEALTTLLGSSPLHPLPKWFKSICGRFLSQILLRPNGVRDVVDFMIGGDEGIMNRFA